MIAFSFNLRRFKVKKNTQRLFFLYLKRKKVISLVFNKIKVSKVFGELSIDFVLVLTEENLCKSLKNSLNE